MWECETPGLAHLDRWFIYFLRHLEAVHILTVASVYSHQQFRGILSLPGSFLHLLFVDLQGWPLWLVESDFPLSFWLAFLQQLWRLSILSCAGGFVLSGIWLPESWLCLECICPISPPWHFLRTAIITEPQALRTEVPVRTGDQAVVIEKVQKAAAFCMPTLGSWGNQESWLSWVWNRVDCAWTNTKGLEFQYFLPLWHHTNPPSRLIPSRSTAPGASEAALSGRRLLLLTSAPGEVEASWIMSSNSLGPWCHGGLWSQPESSRL